MPRKEKTIHYIYKTTCLITGRYYIGMHSTCNIDDGYMGSGKRLRYSLRKHGIEKHKKEILEFFDSRELLIEAEKKAITADMLKDNMCMNLKAGGEGGLMWLSEIHKKKIGKGTTNWLNEKWSDNVYRKKRAKEASIRMKKLHQSGKVKRYDWTGRQHSDETKKLMSEIAKQKAPEQNSQYGTCWITRNGENKKIKKEDLDIWLNEGWIKGRKI